MFIRRNKNRSGTVSVQIIDKSRGSYRVVKTVGSGRTEEEIKLLEASAQQELRQLTGQGSLFLNGDDIAIEGFVTSLSNSQISISGPELVFGTLYDKIGYNKINEPLFRHLIIARIVSPGSKLQTIDYLHRYHGLSFKVDTIYRFMDKLHKKLKTKVAQISFDYTYKVLGGKIGVVFYDMTTVYFETNREDEFRQTGFSKDGKHQNPQIYLGLLIGKGGYPIGYDLFEGSIYEGHTLIPIIQKFEKKYKINKPIIVADSGLLSKNNITALVEEKYQYILGARIKNETKIVKQKILSKKWKNGELFTIEKNNDQKLIVGFSEKRAKKDAFNRNRGLKRLEKQIKTGKFNKSNLNKKGYNKYLQLKGELTISINYEKFNNDGKWDGLKGYVTNTKLAPSDVVNAYQELWHIERAFRLSLIHI